MKKVIDFIFQSLMIMGLLILVVMFIIEVSTAFESTRETRSNIIIFFLSMVWIKGFINFLFRTKPKRKLKIGLDIHGVCDANPDFFVELSRMLISAGHEVHVLTGKRVSDGALQELKEIGISYTHFFSISDYHTESGTIMNYDDIGNPWMDDEIWDRTKGDYCKRNEIDFCIDDTERYGKYFETPFAYMKIKKDEK